MENRPEYFITWLAAAKIGAVTALINHHIKAGPLAHSIKVCSPKLLLIGTELISVTEGILPQLGGLPIFYEGPALDHQLSWATYVTPLWETANSAEPISIAELGTRYDDDLLYIFTSGTTGTPKAARVKHFRFIMISRSFNEFFPMDGTKDVMYCTLPMYHSSAGLLGMSCMVGLGIPVVLRRKFSASHFWDDCRRYNVTIIQYIGELLRFLVSQPPDSADTKHSVRLAIGNGLRPDVWSRFQKRFNIAMIGEFYASTEGNAVLLNATGKTNAIGFVSPLVQTLYPVKLLKYDVTNDAVMRNSKGLCMTCSPGEIGELVGWIDMADPSRRFDGYLGNQDATEKKILRNVFKQGDMYFRTGDLMVMDTDGFVYFKDRIGDTFRWRGENVATTEVAEVLGSHTSIQEANVYGVNVPGFEGRAGMAAVTFIPDLPYVDWRGLYAHVAAQLPAYAMPRFLRVVDVDQADRTGTFKQCKPQYVRDGFNPEVVPQVYFADPAQNTYVRIDAALYRRLISGEVRL
ncbi:solute carrier family 27 [Capsaspora owczarzaki ATCC 30864]|uniref:Solute carrier family 27 n=2 Tax=Capsaspora owczarzaki (strain ATCC 30864) TaxID=595528 RepID=A0A0D2X345_CAPO3|nr:solute carrier family 27 [Capsaspora owczarzaki ATCC 30864]